MRIRPSLVSMSPTWRVHEEDRDHHHHGRHEAGGQDEEQLVLLGFHGESASRPRAAGTPSHGGPSTVETPATTTELRERGGQASKRRRPVATNTSFEVLQT